MGIRNDTISLMDMLAVIHGDGGHHTDKVGLRQSIEDAYKIIYELKAREQSSRYKEQHIETQN